MNRQGTAFGRKSRTRSSADIAIVGMACRFPGASDLSEFWHNIQNAVDATTDVPQDRWNADEFHQPGVRANDRVDTRRGGYLTSPIPFEASDHGIIPSSVDGGEPEQYLVLDAARSALLDAGLPSGMPDGKRVDVIIGRGNYFNRGHLTRLQHGRVLSQTLRILRSLHPDWPESVFESLRSELKASLPPFGPDTIPGQMTNATAGRVANRLNLRGSSFVVDAASASSLVALDLGCRSLQEHRADLVLVGGVYLQVDVDFPMVFQQLGALSKKGESRPFSESADGLIPGEGCGVVVLKRRADAERDGHRIYAMVKGVGVASDGRSSSLASPNPRGHALAMNRAYRQCRIDPASVDLIEAHGLGVPTSDRAELEAIRQVFGPSQRRTLSAVSSMIGHAMPAAGMAGLIASALALHHRMRPPTLRTGRPHPLLTGKKSPAKLLDSASPWVHGSPTAPRRAGVNAFGFSGINAHAVLEEHAASADHPTSPGAARRWESEAILLGAPDRSSWLSLARALLDWLNHSGDVSLRDLAYTLNTNQPNFPFRVGLVVSSLEDLKLRLIPLIERLSDSSRSSFRDARGTYFWENPVGGPGRLAFVFPGEGSQYTGMLADLYPHFPEIRWPFDHADRVAIERRQGVLPSEILFGDGNTQELWTTGPALSMVLSAQWGLFQLLTRLGLRPDAVAGHSSGELLALGAAGSLKINRAFESRIAVLGDMFEQLESTGAVPQADLIAVAADRVRVESTCASLQTSASIAMDNCPHQVVVALQPNQSAGLLEQLRQNGVVCEPLPFGRAYHTPEFSSALQPLREFFATLTLRSPLLPIYSCATAERMPVDPESIRRLAVEQWVQPVAFRPTIERMHEDGLRVFVEVGARGLLTGFIEDTLRPRPAFAIAANLPRRSGITQINHLVASLFAQGVPINTDHLYVRRHPRRIDLSNHVTSVVRPSSIAVGFPEMRVSEAFTVSYSSGMTSQEQRPISRFDSPESTGLRPPHLGPEWSEVVSNGKLVNGERLQIPPTDSTDVDDEAMRAYLETMNVFLDVQRDVMNAFWGVPKPDAPDAPEPSDDHTEPQRIAVLLDSHRGHEPTQRPQSFQELQSQTAVAPSSDHAGPASQGAPREPIKLRVPDVNSDATESQHPWLGSVLEFEPGRRLVAERLLDARLDPVAEHHTLGGRRVSSIDPDRKGLPVVPFTVMAEMLAEAATALIHGKQVVQLKDVQANRWIKYEDDPVILSLRAEVDPDDSSWVHASIFNRSQTSATKLAKEAPVVEGKVLLRDLRPDSPVAEPFTLANGGLSRFTAEQLYAEQWLFHGPPFQALTRVGLSAPEGIEGDIRVLSTSPFHPRNSIAAGSFRTDFIVLDAFTHLLGCWGLDQLSEGDVVFPLRLSSLQIFGEDPAPGTEIHCQITIDAVERTRIRAHANLVRPCGRVWMRLDGWEDWRFFWPNRYRDVFRAPREILVGEKLASAGLPDSASAVWLEPPGDMARPIWRDVLEAVQLSTEERSTFRDLPGPDRRKTHWLWGRIVAKEAVRRLWLDQGQPPVFPADLMVEPDAHGRPCLRPIESSVSSADPAISIAHTDGVAVALASIDPSAKVGIDVERITEREPRFESLAFIEEERDLLGQFAGDSRAEWIARFWCAKEAVAKATGRGLIVGPASVEILSAEADGRILARLRSDLSAACPGWTTGPIKVVTERRSDHVWAWTLGESADL